MTPGPFFIDEFVMFGDSITQMSWQPGGTGAHLSNLYQRKLDVVNRGFSGYNTVWALEVAKIMFPTQIPQSQKIAKKRAVTIWLGANDATLPNRAQHVPLDKFEENIKQLIRIFREHDRQTTTTSDPAVAIILITPPPISVAMRAADCAQRFPDWTPDKMDRDAGRTKQFAETILKIAKDESLPVVDTWTAITKAAGGTEEGLSEFLCDGLHLTPAGYEIVTNQLIQVINEELSYIVSEQLEPKFPFWRDIDPEEPGKSFPKPLDL